MPSHNGKQYRTHGQAYRASKEDTSSKDMTANKDGGPAVGHEGHHGIVAIKHAGGPPYHVKHEDGMVTQHDSHEDLMSHLHDHIPGGEHEEEKNMDDSQMDSDYGSEGSKEALDSLLG